MCYETVCFFCQAEDGIRDLVRSRGLGDVYKRQKISFFSADSRALSLSFIISDGGNGRFGTFSAFDFCLLYTSDAADERSSVDLGGRRIIKKKNNQYHDEMLRQ